MNCLYSFVKYMVLCKKLKILKKSDTFRFRRYFGHKNDFMRNNYIGCLEAVESKGSFRGQGFMVVDIGLLL